MYLSQKMRIAKYLGAAFSRWFLRCQCNSSSISGVNVVLWGIVLMLHAAAPTFGPFFALRFLLGTHLTTNHCLNH